MPEGWRNCLKCLKKGGGTEKRGGETKIFKRGQAGSRGGCNKKGAWNPLMNYAVVSIHQLYHCLTSKILYFSQKNLLKNGITGTFML